MGGIRISIEQIVALAASTAAIDLAGFVARGLGAADAIRLSLKLILRNYCGFDVAYIDGLRIKEQSLTLNRAAGYTQSILSKAGILSIRRGSPPPAYEAALGCVPGTFRQGHISYVFVRV